ncbi:MAG TPA: phosphoribosyltransferase [Spirochaetales bacterium]|nr:phosphoribosyltransferase [Spirochaetales bacterium]HRY53651.1 phosphoribosyltransferase [Spirochaetia bacterium]
MIDRFLAGEDWEEPPAAMAFAASYGSILEEASSLVAELRGRGGEAAPGDAELAARLYVRSPALVNVMLNYKICVEHDLPLHPTVYYELAEARRYRIERPIDELERANRLYRESIELARAAYRLEPGWEIAAAAFRSRLPPEILSFVYTGGLDKYTWRASEPARIAALAAAVRKAFHPELLVAAAHGSIIPGLLLAEYLGIPLYFIRFSMFKRQDETPIVSIADEAWLAAWRQGSALLFDEDVAKGTTLERFTRCLQDRFAESRSACVIRHAGASIRPDFAARVWWD